MPTVRLSEVEIAYDVAGDRDADPVVLICGCGQPALAWQLGLVPALTAAGFRVVTFDNRGVPPSSSPPAPYSVADLVADALGLLDHLDITTARFVGLLHRRLGRRDACDPTSRPGARGGVPRELQRHDRLGEGDHDRRARPRASRLRAAAPLLRDRDPRYLPNQGAARGRGWSTRGWRRSVTCRRGRIRAGWVSTRRASVVEDLARTEAWPSISRPVPRLAFEHDVDSPPGPGEGGSGADPGGALPGDRGRQPPCGVHPRRPGRSCPRRVLRLGLRRPSVSSYRRTGGAGGARPAARAGDDGRGARRR